MVAMAHVTGCELMHHIHASGARSAHQKRHGLVAGTRDILYADNKMLVTSSR
jgi:hypothetical protein